MGKLISAYVLLLFSALPAAVIEGTVTDDLTTAPVESALVEVKGTGVSTYTDAAGHFSLNTASAIGHYMTSGPGSILAWEALAGAEAVVYGADGSLLQRGAAGKPATLVSGLADGLYFVMVTCGERRYMVKLIKTADRCQAGQVCETRAKAGAAVTLVYSHKYYTTKEASANEGDLGVTEELTMWWPDKTNTGVPAGTVLTPSGGLRVTTAGAIIDALDITGQVVIDAPNVTIRNTRIRSNAMWAIDNNSTGLVVEDSEIFNVPVSGQNICHNAIGDNNFTVRRTEISGCENGANIGGDNVTFEDNYVHDLNTTGPSYVWGNHPHTDGIQLSRGSDNIIIRHNWIDPSPGGGVTSAIIMGTDGSSANVWIEDNYLDARGASYAVYANRQNSTNININRNRMYKGYGYTACVKLGQTVTTFDDNRDAGTNALLTPDNGAGGGCTN